MKMTQQSKVAPEHLVGAALILAFFTWFSVSALFDGQIPMGRKLLGVSNLVTRQEHPCNYWFCVGFFLLLTALGWIAVGLNAYRMVRNKNRPELENKINTKE